LTGRRWSARDTTTTPGVAPGRLRRPTVTTTTTTTEHIRNGVDTQRLFATLDLMKEQPEIGRFQFRATNRWIAGSHNRTVIKDFHGAGGEDTSRAEPFVLDAGEPAVLLGTDTGPNPAELVLHALAACVTTSLVYVAAARGVRLTEVESRLEGDINLNGTFGLNTEDHRNGYERIRMTFRIRGDAPPEKLREIVARGHGRSAVFDIVTNGVPVSVDVVTD
jgi:uncharacterized OsmC-like protein